VLLVFKDKSEKAQGNKERASVILEEICGLEAGQGYEGVVFTLAILCLNQAALLGFDSRETLQAWDARLRYSLGEGEDVRGCFVAVMFHFLCFSLNFTPKCHIFYEQASASLMLERKFKKKKPLLRSGVGC